jgi:hypothetical protein
VRKQSNPTDHCPVHAAFSTIGIKELIMADRTEIHCRNGDSRYTLPLHLSTDQGLEVQSSLVSSITTYNRFPLRQSPSKLVEHWIVHFIAARAGRGADTDP